MSSILDYIYNIFFLFWTFLCLKYEQIVDVLLTLANLSPFSRPAQDVAGPVSDKDSSVHRPSKLKVPGGLAYCQGDEGLLKTQVWQCLTEAWKSPGISTETDSLAKTMQPLIFLSLVNLEQQQIVFYPHAWCFSVI